MNICLIVITSFEKYSQKINEIRREQCKQYNIPLFFVYNGEIPEGFVFKKDELYFELNLDKKLLPHLINPIMFFKFTYAVKEFYKQYGYEPDYFVRCTTSCFIDFNKLPNVLNILRKTECIAGMYELKIDTYNKANNNKLFCNGTCMILSNDVAKKLTEDEEGGTLVAVIENDDVAISWMGSKYGSLTDLTYWFRSYECLEALPVELDESLYRHTFYRIKNTRDRETIDVGIWNMLHTKIDKNASSY